MLLSLFHFLNTELCISRYKHLDLFLTSIVRVQVYYALSNVDSPELKEFVAW